MLEAKSEDEIERIIEFRKDLEEQESYAKEGISTAYEGNTIVTIGCGKDYHYQSFKEFCVAQMAKTSMREYAHKTGWDLDELIGDLAQLDDDDSLWEDDVMDYFGGMKGEC